MRLKESARRKAKRRRSDDRDNALALRLHSSLLFLSQAQGGVFYSM